GGARRRAWPRSSVPRLVGDADLAPAVCGNGDDILAPVGVELLAGHVLLRDAEIVAPPAAIEPGLHQFDLDRAALCVGQGVAHRRSIASLGPFGLDRADHLADLDHAVARRALQFGDGERLALLDLGLDVDVESIAGGERQFAAHRRVADTVLA